MDNDFITAENGGIKISEEVIATIATVAAKEVDGVAALAAKMPVELNKKGIKLNTRTYSKGVSVLVEGETVELGLNISVKYGCVLPEVAGKVQDNVAKAVETMTGLKVTAVTVNIVSISTAAEA